MKARLCSQQHFYVHTLMFQRGNKGQSLHAAAPGHSVIGADEPYLHHVLVHNVQLTHEALVGFVPVHIVHGGHVSAIRETKTASEVEPLRA